MKKLILLSVLCTGIALTACQKESVPQNPEANTAENVQSLPPINESFEPEVQLPTRFVYQGSRFDGLDAVQQMYSSYGAQPYHYDSGKVTLECASCAFSTAYCLNRHLNNGYPVGVQVKHSISGAITWVLVIGKSAGPGEMETLYTYLDPTAPTREAGMDLVQNKLSFGDRGTIRDETSPKGGSYEVVRTWSNDGHPGRPFSSTNKCFSCGAF